MMDDKEIFMNLLEFYNNRVKQYNKEIYRMNELVEKLRHRAFALLVLSYEYKKEIENIDKYNMILCKLCYEEISDCILDPCKHCVCCNKCLKKLVTRNCPICRQPITKYFKFYF